MTSPIREHLPHETIPLGNRLNLLTLAESGFNFRKGFGYLADEIPPVLTTMEKESADRTIRRLMLFRTLATYTEWSSSNMDDTTRSLLFVCAGIETWRVGIFLNALEPHNLELKSHLTHSLAPLKVRGKAVEKLQRYMSKEANALVDETYQKELTDTWFRLNLNNDSVLFHFMFAIRKGSRDNREQMGEYFRRIIRLTTWTTK